MRRLVPVLAVLAVGAGACAAKVVPEQVPTVPPDTYAARALRSLDLRVARDPILAERLRDLETGPTASLWHDPRLFRRLDDQTVLLFVAALNTSLRQLPAEECARAASAETPFGVPAAFVGFLSRLDSATVDVWVVLFERLLRAAALEAPDLPLASAHEVLVLMREVRARFNPRVQQRMVETARSRVDAQCQLHLLMLSEMARVPASRLGPVVRATLGGGR